MLPHPTKSRARLARRTLTALGCSYKHARKDILSRGHTHTCSDESPGNGVISNATEQRREPQGEGETGWCQALQSRRLPQPVQHREPLFPGSEPWERDARTARAGPGPAPVPCPRPAADRPRTTQAPSSHSLARQEKKISWQMAPASPSLPAVRATEPVTRFSA